MKIDFEITGHIWKGSRVEENAYPWMAFLYIFDRKLLGIDVRELKLPMACKQNRTTTTMSTITATTTPPYQTTNASLEEDTNLKMSDACKESKLFQLEFVMSHCEMCWVLTQCGYIT